MSAASVWCSRCAAFVDRWAQRAGDTDVQRIRKRTSTVATGVGIVAGGALLSQASRVSPLHDVIAGLIFTVSALLFGYLRLARDAGVTYMAVMAGTFLVFVVVLDWVSAAESNRRLWQSAILIVDILLIMQATPRITLWVVAAMLVYLTVIQAEEAWRFGLFDLSVLAPYEDRLCQGDCEKPPCRRSVEDSTGIALTNIALFLLDFYFTRGFAMQVQREKEKIAAGVTAAQHVAERLASFDLDAAEHVLENQEDMPPDLCESLRVILSHLRTYKPFLPQSVLLVTTLTSSSFASDDPSVSSCNTPLTPAIFPPADCAAVSLHKRPLSLLHLQAALPDVAAPHYTSVHSQMLATVLKHAATCKGVVDHFCGDAVSLSYNASSLCARHPMMAVQTAAALCLEVEEGVCAVDEVPCVLRGGVATGHARVGTMGVPELQRHCIVGMLDTVCQHIVQAAVLLERPLLCLHSTAVDVSFAWQTRVLLHRLTFSRALTLGKCDEMKTGDCVTYEVVERCAASGQRPSPRGPSEWMYELPGDAAAVWDVYNKAGIAYHRADTDPRKAAFDVLRTLSASEQHVALFEAELDNAVTLRL